MISQIFKHELRLMMRDRMLAYLLPIFAVMVGYAIYNGVSWSRFQSATVSAAQAKAQANFADLKARVGDLEHGAKLGSAYDDPRDAGLVSRVSGYEFATLPPSAMSVLAVGQSDLYPYYVQVTAKPIQDLAATDEIENPTNLATGRFDLSFVIVYLFPLLILALTFNLLSIEREQGTQALIFSQPVTLRHLVAGKVLLRACIVFGTAVTLALVGFLLGGMDLSADTLARLGMWVVIVIAYGSFWFGLAIIVNALGRKSSTNAMALVTCWLLFVVLLPSMLNVLAKTVYPVPSRIELVQATRRAQEAVMRTDSQLATKAMEEGRGASMSQSMNRGAETLREYYQNIIGTEKKIDRLSAPVKQRFASQVEAQQQLVSQLHFLSPAVMTELAIADLAGTGPARYRVFNQQVMRYHDQWASYFTPFVMKMRQLQPKDYDAMPRFHMPEEKLSDVAARSVREIAPLCLGGLLVVMLGIVLLRRYPVVG
jgi:ABC-2 type transport system permease protein